LQRSDFQPAFLDNRRLNFPTTFFSVLLDARVVVVRCDFVRLGNNARTRSLLRLHQPVFAVKAIDAEGERRRRPRSTGGGAAAVVGLVVVEEAKLGQGRDRETNQEDPEALAGRVRCLYIRTDVS
jgi:hypothetical protein